MKTLYKLIFIFILLPFYSKATTDDKHPFSKEKTISETFTASADATTQISNSYGSINVFLWDENKVSITVNIKVSGKSQSTVEDKLKATTVDFSGNNSQIIAKTVFETSNWNWGWGNSNVSYEVNYTVKIPKRGNVELKNSYGNIFMDKLNGNSQIKCSYGKIFLGDLMGKNTIELAYVDKSRINSVNDLNLKSQYSDLQIDKGDNVSVRGNYNDYIFSNINQLNSSSSYDDIIVKNIGNYTCNGNYVDLHLTEVDNSTLGTNYGEINVYPNLSFKNTTINANYTSIKINVPIELNFDFDIRCVYGNLKTNLDLDYTVQTSKGSIKQYKGTRKNSGKSKFTVITNYGSVQILGK